MKKKKKKAEKLLWQLHLQAEKSRVGTCEQSSTGDTKANGEGGGGGAPGTEAEIPLQPMVKSMVKQLCSCNMWRIRGVHVTLHGGDPC